MENAHANASLPQAFGTPGQGKGGADLNASTGSLSSFASLRSRRTSGMSGSTASSAPVSFKSPLSMTPTSTLRAQPITPSSDASANIAPEALMRKLFNAQNADREEAREQERQQQLAQWAKERSSYESTIAGLEREKRAQADTIARLDRDVAGLRAQLEEARMAAVSEQKERLADLEALKAAQRERAAEEQRRLDKAASATVDAHARANEAAADAAVLQKQLDASAADLAEARMDWRAEHQLNDELKAELDRVKTEIGRLRSTVQASPSPSQIQSASPSPSPAPGRRLTRSSVQTPLQGPAPDTPSSIGSSASTLLSNSALRDRIAELGTSNDVLRREIDTLQTALREAEESSATAQVEATRARAEADALRVRDSKLRQQRDTTILNLKRSFQADLTARLEEAAASTSAARDDAAVATAAAEDLKVRLFEAEQARDEATDVRARMEQDLDDANKHVKSIKARLEKEKGVSETLRSDLTLMHKQHKRDTAKLREQFHAGLYDARYEELLLKQQETAQTLELCQASLDAAHEILDLSTATQSIYESMVPGLSGLRPMTNTTTVPSDTTLAEEAARHSAGGASIIVPVGDGDGEQLEHDMTKVTDTSQTTGGDDWTDAAALFSPDKSFSQTPIKMPSKTPSKTPLSARRQRLSARLSTASVAGRRASALSVASRLSDMNGVRRMEEMSAQIARLREVHRRELEDASEKMTFVELEHEAEIATAKETHETMLRKMEDEMQAMSQDLTKSLSDLEEAMKELDECEAERHQGSVVIAQLNEKLAECKCEMDKLQEERSNAELERADLLKMAAASAAEAEAAAEMMATLRQDMISSEDNQAQKELIEELGLELNRSDEKVDELQLELQQAIEECGDKHKQLVEYAQKIEDLTCEVNEIDGERSVAHMEIERLKEQLADQQLVEQPPAESDSGSDAQAGDAVVHPCKRSSGGADEDGAQGVVAVAPLQVEPEAQVEHVLDEAAKERMDLVSGALKRQQDELVDLRREKSDLMDKCEQYMSDVQTAQSQVRRLEKRLRGAERETQILNDKLNLMLTVDDVPDADSVAECVRLRGELAAMEEEVNCMHDEAKIAAEQSATAKHAHVERLREVEERLQTAEAALLERLGQEDLECSQMNADDSRISCLDNSYFTVE